jgi:hypothetical protein
MSWFEVEVEVLYFGIIFSRSVTTLWMFVSLDKYKSSAKSFARWKNVISKNFHLNQRNSSAAVANCYKFVNFESEREREL